MSVGVSVMVNGGFTSSASHVYFLGMGCLFSNAELRIVSCFMVVGLLKKVWLD